MDEKENIEAEIFSKFDYELSKKELNQIFLVYNECFYDFQVNTTKQILSCKRLLGKLRTWQWYYAKVNGQIVGIASYCYSYQHAKEFNIRPDKGENVLSVAVREKYRRFGIARLLMNVIIKEHGSIKDLVVEIKTQNPYYRILRDFYASLEFEELPLKPDEPEDPENVYLIRKCRIQ